MPTFSVNPFSSASESAAALACSQVTASDLMASYLQRIETLDPSLHAFIAVYAADAANAASAADAAHAAGYRVGPFHGLPVAVKDIIDIQGRNTTGGSMVWKDRISPVTATLVERMRSAGLIVIGKTHTVEFAMGSFGTNQHWGSPRNPWDNKSHRATGGSSAGSAAAVAAGLAPWAIGTDTGGSVRIPSSWCGLTGLKTTIGRISCHGVLPLSTTLDTPGPMCRSVEDAAALYAILKGADPNDPITLGQPQDDPAEQLQRGVRGLRLATMPSEERQGCCPEVLAAFDQSLRLLGDLGAEIVERPLPRRFDELGTLVGGIIGAEGYYFVGDLADDLDQPVDDDIRPRIQVGKGMSAKRYYGLLREQQEIKTEFNDALADVDGLLTPTTMETAPRIADIDQSGTAAQFTRPFNMVEYCALALPNGFSKSGLPISLQIACKPHQEGLALRIGFALQQCTDWHTRQPSL